MAESNPAGLKRERESMPDDSKQPEAARQRSSHCYLRVFTVHDDPFDNCNPEERDWKAIAADDELQAKAVYAALYRGDALAYADGSWAEVFRADEIEATSWPERLRPKAPGRLRDLESLRLCGFAGEGEPHCESCGFASLGIEEYMVCDRCDQCAECGHLMECDR